MPLRFGRLVRRFGQGCFLAKAGPRASRKYVRRWRGASGETEILRGRLPLSEASRSNGLIPDLVAPIRPLQLYADGGYQLRIRSLEGTPNYGPRQVLLKMVIHGYFRQKWGLCGHLSSTRGSYTSLHICFLAICHILGSMVETSSWSKICRC
jgi:hypothetical protein